MKDRFYLLVCVGLAIAVGYLLATKPVEASGSGSVADSIFRVANSMERMEAIMRAKGP